MSPFLLMLHTHLFNYLVHSPSCNWSIQRWKRKAPWESWDNSRPCPCVDVDKTWVLLTYWAVTSASVSVNIWPQQRWWQQCSVFCYRWWQLIITLWHLPWWWRRQCCFSVGMVTGDLFSVVLFVIGSCHLGFRIQMFAAFLNKNNLNFALLFINASILDVSSW